MRILGAATLPALALFSILALLLPCSAKAAGTRKLQAFRIWESMINDAPRVTMEISDDMPMDNIITYLENKFAALDAELEYPNAPEKFFVNAVRTRAGVRLTETYDLPEKVFVIIGQESYFFPSDNIGEKLYVPLPHEERELEVEVLSASPRLVLIKNFLSAAEADDVIDTAKPLMKRSTTMVSGSQTGGEKTGVNDVRTSSTAWLMDREVPVVETIEKRVETLSTINMSWAESMQVLHYGHKQHYHVHHDFFDKMQYLGDDRWNSGHNRILTVFFYLTDVEQGGETIFPYGIRPKSEWGQVKKHGNCDIHDKALKVKAEKGSAIIFYHVAPRNQTEEHIELDITSLHGGCDPIVGEKWAANYWVRNGILKHASAQIVDSAASRRSTQKKGEDWEYGIDESWPIQHAEVTSRKVGNIEKKYAEFMRQCADKHGKQACDESEAKRIARNLNQPPTVTNFTEFGGIETNAPSGLPEAVQKFWAKAYKQIEATVGDDGPYPASYTNAWRGPLKSFVLSDGSLNGGEEIAAMISKKVSLIVQWWTGHNVRVTRDPVMVMYGPGHVVAPHLMEAPHQIGVALTVVEGVDGAPTWPIELYGHEGVAVNHTLTFDKILMWEAQSVIFGRPFPVTGTRSAAIYVFFETLEKSTLISSESDTEGATKLHTAAALGRTEELRALMEEGIKQGQQWHLATDVNDWGPLHEAARGGHIEAVTMLVENGVDISGRTNAGRGWSALALARENLGETHEVVKYLRSIGAADKSAGQN
mmetsp:Transcript_18462/g.45318  ORF Transcript_18462/g.45318 Transcript_18462/m.45318 type:complete len:762 (+) Transcript_18462:139-2424(+)